MKGVAVMKRNILWMIAILLGILLVGCGGQDSTVLDLEAEADGIIRTYSLTTGTRYSSGSEVEGEYLDEELIRSYYGDVAEMPDFGSVESYVVYIDETRPTQPCEFGIFRLKPAADKELFMTFLQARIELKLQGAIAYPTMDTEALSTAVFTERDGYIWYAAVKGGNQAIDTMLQEKLGS